MLSLSDICEEQEEEEEEEDDVERMKCQEDNNGLERDESTCHLIRADTETPYPGHTCDTRVPTPHRPALGELYTNGVVSNRSSKTDGYSLISESREKNKSNTNTTMPGKNSKSERESYRPVNHLVARVNILPASEKRSSNNNNNSAQCADSTASKQFGSASPKPVRDEIVKKNYMSSSSDQVNRESLRPLASHQSRPECLVHIPKMTTCKMGPYGDSVSVDSLPATTPSDSCSQTSSLSAIQKSDVTSSHYSCKEEEEGGGTYRAMLPFHEAKRGLTRKQLLQLSAMSGCGFLLVTIIILWVMSPALF